MQTTRSPGDPSIAVGAALIGLLATVEGASIRFENRRLRKEIHKMEREINFLRTTQPAAAPRSEPDSIEPEEKPALPAAPAAATLSEPATMPVYGEQDDWPPDGDDDDVYSGGRAV